MKKLMNKFKVLTIFAAVFFMVLALPTKSEAADYKIVNISLTDIGNESLKVKVGKYYFWQEEQSDHSHKVYASKYADGRKKTFLYQTQKWMSASPMLTNGTYVWYTMHDDSWVSTIYRIKINGKGRKVYQMQYTGLGHWVTLLGCRNNYLYYSIFGNKAGNTEIFKVSVKQRYQTPKKVKTAQDYGGDGARYIYLTGTNDKTALRIYDVKTKKTKSIKKAADAYVDTVQVFGGKLYYTIGTDGKYDLYQASLSGSGRKKLISGMDMKIGEMGKVTSAAIWFKESANRWWKYPLAAGEPFRYDGLMEYLADIQ